MLELRRLSVKNAVKVKEIDCWVTGLEDQFFLTGCHRYLLPTGLLRIYLMEPKPIVELHTF